MRQPLAMGFSFECCGSGRDQAGQPIAPRDCHSFAIKPIAQSRGGETHEGLVQRDGREVDQPDAVLGVDNEPSSHARESHSDELDRQSSNDLIAEVASPFLLLRRNRGGEVGGGSGEQGGKRGEDNAISQRNVSKANFEDAHLVVEDRKLCVREKLSGKGEVVRRSC